MLQPVNHCKCGMRPKQPTSSGWWNFHQWKAWSQWSRLSIWRAIAPWGPDKPWWSANLEFCTFPFSKMRARSIGWIIWPRHSRTLKIQSRTLKPILGIKPHFRTLKLIVCIFWVYIHNIISCVFCKLVPGRDSTDGFQYHLDIWTCPRKNALFWMLWELQMRFLSESDKCYTKWLSYSGQPSFGWSAKMLTIIWFIWDLLVQSKTTIQKPTNSNTNKQQFKLKKQIFKNTNNTIYSHFFSTAQMGLLTLLHPWLVLSIYLHSTANATVTLASHKARSHVDHWKSVNFRTWHCTWYGWCDVRSYRSGARWSFAGCASWNPSTKSVNSFGQRWLYSTWLHRDLQLPQCWQWMNVPMIPGHLGRENRLHQHQSSNWLRSSYRNGKETNKEKTNERRNGKRKRNCKLRLKPKKKMKPKTRRGQIQKDLKTQKLADTTPTATASESKKDVLCFGVCESCVYMRLTSWSCQIQTRWLTYSGQPSFLEKDDQPRCWQPSGFIFEIIWFQNENSCTQTAPVTFMSFQLHIQITPLVCFCLHSFNYKFHVCITHQIWTQSQEPRPVQQWNWFDLGPWRCNGFGWNGAQDLFHDVLQRRVWAALGEAGFAFDNLATPKSPCTTALTILSVLSGQW